VRLHGRRLMQKTHAKLARDCDRGCSCLGFLRAMRTNRNNPDLPKETKLSGATVAAWSIYATSFC